MVYQHEFKSISEVLKYINTHEITESFKNANCEHSKQNDKRFTGTSSFDEALELLQHGWDSGTKQINEGLKVQKSETNIKQKTVYDVTGFQCSVPRYLQGIPTNMVNKRNVKQNNKIVTINKNITYSSKTSQKEIIEQSVKVIKVADELERKGYRCNINIMFVTRSHSTTSVTKVRIKDSSQKMNIKQMAFPIAHPSMLRRVMFALVERYPECDNRGFTFGYGYPEMCREYCKTNDLCFESKIYEDVIKDIEQYRVQ